MDHALRRSCAVAAFATAALFPSSAALAQSSTAGDIIVTATRRAQALADVPIAVSAISADQLENSGTTDIRSLNQLAPSLLVSGATSEVSFTARIRGVGTVGENPGIESSVALFIDGVYRSRTGTGLSDLGEVERIEVLRGPQGTLFGRNASAGLINVTTKKPAFENYVYGAGTYGNYNQIRLEGGVNWELAPDQLAVKVEALWNKRDGFVEDVVSDRSFNDRDRWMVRGQALWEPSDDLSIRLIGDYGKRDEQCCAASILESRSLSRDAQGNVVIGPNTLVPLLRALGSEIVPGELYKTATSPTADFSSEATDWGVSGELNWDLGFGTITSITAYRDYWNRQGQDGDYNNINFWARTDLQRRFRTFSEELRVQGTLFDDRLDWLVGGYYSNEKLRVSDNLRFGTDAARYGDCLIAAALSPANFNPAVTRCTNLPAAFWPGYDGAAAILGVSPLNGTGAGDNGYFKHESTNWALFTHNSFDIIKDRLTLTVGARYTHETKEIDSVFDPTNSLCQALRFSNTPISVATNNLTFAGVPCAINASAGPGFAKGTPGTKISEGEWTGTAVLSWKPMDDLMIYASWARGYKAGGFNLDSSAVDIACSTTVGSAAQQAACAAALARPVNTVGNARPEAVDLQFAAETVISYEIGAKFSRPGFSANVALFRQEFSNYQLNTYNGVNFEVTNIQACKDSLNGADTDASSLTGSCDSDNLKPGVVAKGLEIELFASPIENVSFTAGLTYIDTAFQKNLVGTEGRPLSNVLFQLPGRQISNAPPYVMTGSASWTPPIGDSLRGLLYLDYRFQDSVNTGSDLDIEKVQEAFITFNGRIGLSNIDRKWSIELWGQNLFNQQYFQIAADMPLHGSGTYRAVADGRVASANQLYVTFPGEPRTFGITGRFRF